MPWFVCLIINFYRPWAFIIIAKYSRCGQTLLSSRPAELWWTRVEGIQKQALWIEVHFLQTFLAVFCVPLAPLHSIPFLSTSHRASLSRGKVSRLNSVSRGGTGRYKTPWKVVQKCLHLRANSCPRRLVVYFTFCLFSQVLKRELYEHKVGAWSCTSITICTRQCGCGRLS